MSRFCGGSGSVPALSVDELRTPFADGILPMSLPPMVAGLAAEEWVQQYVQQLDASGRLPKPADPKKVVTNMFGAPEEKDPLAAYTDKEKAFQDAVKAEYCWYERRYFAALDMFLSSVSNASFRGQTEAVSARLEMAKILNQKVTLLTQIVNGIAKFRFQQHTRFQGDINSLNTSLKERQKQLIEQANILSRETAAADLHKNMVSYTVEKNKANQNLLTLFGILNVVAIGMVYYIARS
jgi:hypothetical protein